VGYGPLQEVEEKWHATEGYERAAQLRDAIKEAEHG